MLLQIGFMMAIHIVGMATQICFYAISAYFIARYAHKGWKAGE